MTDLIIILAPIALISIIGIILGLRHCDRAIQKGGTVTVPFGLFGDKVTIGKSNKKNCYTIIRKS
jgi:hypothetical protein